MGCCVPKSDKVAADGEGGGDNFLADKDILEGPVTERRTQDICWIVIFLLSWLLFLIVTLSGAGSGQPSRLYAPRDYRGAYCGVSENFNNGPDLEKAEKRTYMMNVSKTTDTLAKELMCASVSQLALRDIWGATSADYKTYLCACCLEPCDSCPGSMDLENFADVGSLSSTIGGKLQDLTSINSASDLFNPAGRMGDFASNVWNQATTYFHPVCVKDCQQDYHRVTSHSRTYTYTPDSDDPLQSAWTTLGSDASVPSQIRTIIAGNFTFHALSFDDCPYPPRHCVPFPGVEFEELAGGYCTFKMATEVIDAVGGSAAAVFESLGLNRFAEVGAESFGKMWGDFEESIDAFVIVFFCAFIIGMLAMILLRFTVGFCVWISIFFVFALFILGGGMCLVRSTQCAGTSLFASGQQKGVAVAVAGQATVTNAITNQQMSEELTGDRGSGYNGKQSRTRSGKTCQKWTVDTPHVRSYTPADYSILQNAHNWCRNPFNDGDENVASTIWCYTTDTETRWELCSPVGVIQPECAQGYEVSGETGRTVLEVCGYIFFAMAFFWLLLICCFCSRIRMAIQLSKVAALYMTHTPFILLVPIIQAFIAFIWCLLWALSAAFLLSQVDESSTPDGFYSFSVAKGTDDTQGKCFDDDNVWKDADGCTGTDCWRCYPPRYQLGVRFFISFFVFLWNNAFLVACGQCIIAGSVCVWFFAKRDAKSNTPSIRRATWNAFRYHLGSLAFGSFILAVVQFIRYLMKYVEQQAKARREKVIVVIARCLQCCIWCFEQLIKFLNKNAYIQIALLGKDFCSSAKAAYKLIMNNILRFGTVAALGTIIHALGSMIIIVSTTMLGYFVLKGMHPNASPVVPLCIYATLGYLVGKLYFNIFGLAVDASLQCVIITENLEHDGDFVPGPLKNLLPATKDSHEWQWGSLFCC